MSTESEAIKAEAAEEPQGISFQFEGHEYTILAGQPTPKAMEYLADYIVQNNGGAYALLFVREVIGQDAWDEWCLRHRADQVVDMMMASNEAYRGN